MLKRDYFSRNGPLTGIPFGWKSQTGVRIVYQTKVWANCTGHSCYLNEILL
jgi:hypothetical protein